jgi:hypothetical protein
LGLSRGEVLENGLLNDPALSRFEFSYTTPPNIPVYTGCVWVAKLLRKELLFEFIEARGGGLEFRGPWLFVRVKLLLIRW